MLLSGLRAWLWQWWWGDRKGFCLLGRWWQWDHTLISGTAAGYKSAVRVKKCSNPAQPSLTLCWEQRQTQGSTAKPLLGRVPAGWMEVSAACCKSRPHQLLLAMKAEPEQSPDIHFEECLVSGQGAFFSCSNFSTTTGRTATVGDCTMLGPRAPKTREKAQSIPDGN